MWEVSGRGGLSLPLGCMQWYCPSVGDRYVHNPQDGSGQTLSAVSHHASSDRCSLVAPQALRCTNAALHGQQGAVCEGRPGYVWPQG